MPSAEVWRGCVNAATSDNALHTLHALLSAIDCSQLPMERAGLRLLPLRRAPALIRAMLESMGPSSTSPMAARPRYPTLLGNVPLAVCDWAWLLAPPGSRGDSPRPHAA